MIELLSPAGDFESAKQALYNGADAIYCASERFGARAYAKNLTLDELSHLLILAHSLGKKIYVTLNIMIKENELKDAYQYANTLYSLGVDGLILADYALIRYVISNLNGMEAHISTQAGIKDLEDALFFKEKKGNRLVLARETSYDDIKEIKEKTNLPLEIFAHGALCVSYSGGCLFSSILYLRSGNRGRCAQNCRREYEIYKNDKLFAKKAYHLAMKDLNTSSYLDKLSSVADSLKIEGRMKSPDYVKTVTSEYRQKLDNKNYNPEGLLKIFHRQYTKGFLFNEDNGTVVDEKMKGNEGELIGNIIKKENKYTKVFLNKKLRIKDRIKIGNNYYFTVDEIFDKNMKKVTESEGISYLNIFENMNNNDPIVRMIDSSLDLSITDKYKNPIIINIYGSKNNKLKLSTKIFNKEYISYSEEDLIEAKTKPLDNDNLFKLLSKLKETSFYLKDINNKLEGSLFMSVAGINLARRNLINQIETDMQNKRELKDVILLKDKLDDIKSNICITSSCYTDEQYRALKEENIDYIYYNDSYSPYVNSKYKDTQSPYILVGSYGGLYKYKDKEIITDYSFNVLNSDNIYYLHKDGAKYVTLSVEASLEDIKNVYSNYKYKFNADPNLEITVYGKENLMTMKYCPLKRYNECGKCKNNNYSLDDGYAKFPIIHEGCITHIINSKPTNLIDDLKEISKYTNRFRLSFTNESYEETKEIIKKFKDKIFNNSNKKYFDSKNDTRAYYKREIL